MIDLEVYLAVSCKVVNGEFQVYIVKNMQAIEITPYLSDYEIASLRLKFDVKRELQGDWPRD